MVRNCSITSTWISALWQQKCGHDLSLIELFWLPIHQSFPLGWFSREQGIFSTLLYRIHAWHVRNTVLHNRFFFHLLSRCTLLWTTGRSALSPTQSAIWRKHSWIPSSAMGLIPTSSRSSRQSFAPRHRLSLSIYDLDVLSFLAWLHPFILLDEVSQIAIDIELMGIWVWILRLLQLVYIAWTSLKILLFPNISLGERSSRILRIARSHFGFHSFSSASALVLLGATGFGSAAASFSLFFSSAGLTQQNIYNLGYYFLYLPFSFV